MTDTSLTELARDAAHALCAEADVTLSQLEATNDLLAMLRVVPEDLQVALPTLRAAKALFDGLGADAAADALREFSDFYLQAPLDACEYLTAPARAAQTAGDVAHLDDSEMALLAEGLRLLHGAHWTTLIATGGRFIRGFGARGVIRDAHAPVGSVDELCALVRSGAQPAAA